MVSTEGLGRTSWGRTAINGPKYLLEKAEDGLHPDFSALYEIPKITKKQAEKILNGLFVEEKEKS